MRSVWSRLACSKRHCHRHGRVSKQLVHTHHLSTASSFKNIRRSSWACSGWLTRTTVITPVSPKQRAFGTSLRLGRDLNETRDSTDFFRDGEPHIQSDDAAAAQEAKRQSEEEELREAATQLHSMSIDHWSLDDVVAFEPMPGGQQPPKVPSTTTADPHFMMPQSPWAPDHLKRQNYARIWTAKKIAKMETAIARFAVRVCGLVDLHSQWPSNLIVLPEAIRPIAKQTADDQRWLRKLLDYRMKELANRFGPISPDAPPDAPDDLLPFIPSYAHFEDGLHHELLRDLNSSLVELFDGYKSGHMSFKALLVKISHNLLVSSAPPNVQTMNILLLGFYSCDKYSAPASSETRYAILDWLIEICVTVMIRPNEVTCATILASYRRRGMMQQFTRFLMLMTGTGDTHALMYTKMLRPTRANSPRLTPKYMDEETPAYKRESRVFKQSVYPSSMIFTEVIKGVAKFYTLEDAVMICKSFTSQEWGYDWSCLHYLLNACIIQSDWQSGVWVWEEIKAFRAAGHEEPIRILAAMAALCVRCEEKEMFAEVLAYSTQQLKKITKIAFVDIATEILNRAVEKVHDNDLYAMTLDESAEITETRQAGREWAEQMRRRLEHDPMVASAVTRLGDAFTRRDRRSELRHVTVEDDGEVLGSADVDWDLADSPGSNDPVEWDPSLAEHEKVDDDINLLSQAEGGDDIDEAEYVGASQPNLEEDGDDASSLSQTEAGDDLDEGRHVGVSQPNLSEDEAENTAGPRKDL